MSEHDPTEHVREELHEHAVEHSHGHKEGPKWIGLAALTAAMLAALAAIGGSMASTQLTNAMRSQIESNDKWGEYQSNSIKEKILQHAATRTPEDEKDLAKYKDRDKIRQAALARTDESERALHTHETLERGVTFFHISIAIVAIAVLTRRKLFFMVSLASGAGGLVFFIWGVTMHFAAAPPEVEETHHPASQATTAEH